MTTASKKKSSRKRKPGDLFKVRGHSWIAVDPLERAVWGNKYASEWTKLIGPEELVMFLGFSEDKFPDRRVRILLLWNEKVWYRDLELYDWHKWFEKVEMPK